ncbi:hypothetical protein [Bacillus badius]|uniref:Uncharacterized protein n=1 Tax=Bacillus badius TaxID=1455 RepID=A0ABR5B1B6_BACBA|nr:hypothetical protein [Bacillus badius]KIL80759.1 hypothetical protein SD77_0607 [Bacillus badius]MED4715313.1 hypothetical protein [Bacillus badius]
MAILNFFLLNTNEQPDLFFSDGDKLDLDKIKNVMVEYQAPVSEDGNINGEGFVDVETTAYGEKEYIKSFCTAQGSLGYYNQAKLVEGVLKTVRVQHTFYSKSLIHLTEDSELIIKFDQSNDEIAKTKVKSLVESLGFETQIFRLDSDLMRKIKDNDRYTWTAAKIEKIEKKGDNTKKVSYEIDPSNDIYQSEVDELYREHGKMSHIQAEIPSQLSGGPNKVTVKLYKDGHRIVIDENQFADQDSFKNFTLYLFEELKKLKDS